MKTFAALAAGLLVAACSSQATVEPAAPTPTPTPADEGQMQITSPAFDAEATIPVRHTCDGADLSPPLDIAGIPDDAASLVLIVDDPDAPVGTWDHWIAFDIAPTGRIAEGVPQLGSAGSNSWGRIGYGGPCPPSGVHRYFFKLYALDVTLGLAEGATKEEILRAMESHILAEASLMGRYGR